MHAMAATNPPVHPMVAIRDLFLATDLRPESDAAFDHVRLLAERFAAEVTLYHAVEVLTDPYPGRRSEPRDALWMESAARRLLEERALGLCVPCSTVVERVPSARQAVLEMIRGRRPDLAVMAAHDHGALAHLLGASVTENVVEHIRTPVLAVRHGCPRPYRRILVPTDLSLASRLAFPMAALLAREFEAEVIAVHVASPPTLYVLNDFPPPSPPIPGEAALREFLRPDFPDAPVIAQVSMGSPWEQIVRSALDEEVDLIVMATRGHDGLSDRILGSNTERVIRHAPCPVLVA